MNQIWVSGDWHLFNRDPFDKCHPTRTPDEFQIMYDNYVSTIKEGDLFLFLGDLCDVETATDEELDLIKSLLHAIPGYKVMMRGNHDTMDDYFYLMLGFDEICQIGKCHHLVFSHKPCLVGIDEINIHAHLHSEKDHMLNFQHMNVWKWTELNGTPDEPVLLQDLFDLYDKLGNTAEPTWGDPDVYQSKDKLSPWKKLSDYSEKDVLDFSDKFTLAPMDEAVRGRTMEDIIHLNDRLNGFKYGFRSDDGISDEYLSDYRVLSPIKFERARGGVCWDFAVYQADYFRKNFPSVQFTMWYVIFDVGPYWPTHTFMTFRYEGKTYYFESSFKRCAGVWEVESEEDAVNFVMHEMAAIDTGVDDLLSHDYYIYRYNALDTRIPGMSAPEFMKHIEKKGHPVKHVYRDDYTVSLYSPVNESADMSDGILDEVLFQDIEQTKRWLADDDTYQNELDATEYSDSRKPTKMRGKNDVIAESSKRKVYKDPTELHKPDRAESDKLAKKYDIPNVGRTTPEEYEEARKSPEERSAEKRERQLTQLQRARSVKKRKAIVRKVKSKIPFVKNESVEAIALRSDRIDTTGSIYTKVMQSEGGKITEYAMMCADLIHSITSINPELLDAQRILTVQSAEELIAEFKRQQSEWIEQYNKNITFDHQLALLYQVMNARRGFKIKEAYPYLIPYNLSPEKFRRYVQYRIDEWREMINILEEALRINLQFLVLDSAEAARISSITDKKRFIKEMKKVVDQNADRITEKHPDGSRTIDFSLINRGKVFICGQVYDEQKFMRKPSQYLARLSYYDYIIVTHGGSLIEGTWTMDPITFDNVSYDKVTDLLDVLGQDGSQILVMACNPDGIKLPPKKYSNVDYADANVIMESGGAISSQIDLSNWSKEIKKSIKRVNKLKAIINTCVTDAYLLTPPDQIQFITAENFELSHDTNFVFATVAVENSKKTVQKYHYAFNTILDIYESINHAANIICTVAQQYGDSSNRGYRVKAIREDIDGANLYESFWAEGNQIRDVYLMPEDIVLPDPMMCCEVAYAFDLGVRNGKPFACNYLIETIQNGNVVDRTPVSHQELYDVINASSDSVVGEFDISSYDSTEHSPLYGDRKHFFYNYNMPKEYNTAAEKLNDTTLYEMAYEDYCDHFYARLKSLAAEYNKREDIFKHTAKILKCDQTDLPKFECRVETSSEKQLCFSMVDPDTSFEIKCEYEKYLKEMIKELEKETKEYPGAKSIWTADAEGTIYVNLELGQLNEAAIKRVSDDGKPVPKTCPKCGSKIGLYLKGEPVWLCSNQKCGTYYGTAPMNESAMCSVPLYYLSYENLHDDLYPVGKCLFTTIDQAVSEVVWESKNRHSQNKTHIPCDMFVHVTEPGYYELRSSDQVCGAKWSIDNITLNCIGGVHINADGSYEMMKDIQESYQFELVNKTLRFMDPINESVNKTEKLYPVYIMLVHSGTIVSNVIKKVSHSEYSHASISFDSSMSKMYSFARKDPKNPFIGGFRYESIGKGFYEKKEVPYGVYVVPCTEDQIKRMKKRLTYFEKNQEKFTFDFVGLVTNYAGIVNNPAYSWFCSRFVADILNAGSPEGKVYVPEPSLQDPDDFKRAVFARYVASGDNLMKYNQKEVDRATKRILRAEEMYHEQLNESVHYNRFDPADPYAVTVMRYQLSNMNEAVMDEFLRYIKSFHVELDPNGNVILTRRVYNQLDHHFIQTKQALKTMKKAGDLEGMKENLAKLYYMIQLITDQYMDKKTVSISKTVKKDMIDLRSVMLNVFQQNLQYVEEMDPKFNFQSYYDGSVYGKKTKIPISGVTSIGKTLGTLL